MGLFEAAALAASQSGEAFAICFCVGALRHGGGNALRNYRSARREAEHLCHGAQVVVERGFGRPAIGRISRQSRSVIYGRSRKTSRRICHVRPNRRKTFRSVGGKPGIEGRHSDTGRSL